MGVIVGVGVLVGVGVFEGVGVMVGDGVWLGVSVGNRGVSITAGAVVSGGVFWLTIAVDSTGVWSD